MSTRHDRVRAYYESFDEWRRLDSPEGSIEYRRALEILGKHLSPGCRVLDLGGGAGRYSATLAQRGHRVVLADVSPALLASAREKLARLDLGTNIESIDEVNALDLGSYSEATFDAAAQHADAADGAARRR